MHVNDRLLARWCLFVVLLGPLGTLSTVLEWAPAIQLALTAFMGVALVATMAALRRHR